MENKKFEAYGDYKCTLKSGREINLERSIYENTENLQEDLNAALNRDYENELANIKEEELKFFEELKLKLYDWQSIAEKVKILEMAKEYDEACKKVEEMETTNNKWVNTKEWRYDNFNISNKSYKMHIRIYENTKNKDGEEIPYRWEVYYWLYTNTDGAKLIASIDRKVFTDKEKAYKYVEGRKKYFSNYFEELYQPIRREDKNYFKCNGKLIKHYKLENIE